MPCKTSGRAPTGPWCDRCHERIGDGIPTGLGRLRCGRCFLRPYRLIRVMERQLRQTRRVAS